MNGHRPDAGWPGSPGRRGSPVAPLGTLTAGRTAALAAVALFILASCGSGGDPATGKATTTASSSGGGGVPTSSVEGPGSNTTGASRGDYTANLAEGLTAAGTMGAGPAADTKVADCLASRWVEAIGVERLRQRVPQPSELTDPAYDYRRLGLSRSQASAMIAALDTCGIDVYQKTIDALSQGIDATQKACLRRELPRSELVRLAIDGLYQGGNSGLTARLATIARTCGIAPPGGSTTTSG